MLEILVWGIFGLIFGSFTNVLILREGEKSLGGRSECPHCHTTLRWFELVPVLSFVFLMGRCRTCTAKISWQYPIVELLTAAFFVIIGLSGEEIALRVLGAAISILLIAISVYDLRYTLIPDRWVYGFAALAFISGILTFAPSGAYDILLFCISGPLLAFPLFLLWLFSKGMWMGLGDSKLVLGFGWLLGLFPGYIALSMAFILGAFVGVVILLPLKSVITFLSTSGITRFREQATGFTMRSEVPFGPFLIIALCIVWICSLYEVPLMALLLDFLSLS